MKLNLFKKQFPGATVSINYPISHNSMLGKRLFEEGYNYNVVVYRCVENIIRALKEIKIEIKDGEDYLDPEKNKSAKIVYDLLNKPNPKQYKNSFLAESFVNYLILGEMFLVTAEDFDRVPQEIWNLDPLEMSIKTGRQMPKAYIHKVQGSEVTFDVDPLTGESQVLHFKAYNPLNKWRGMSPLMSASLAADTNNAGLRWNHSLLKNGGRLTGIVKYKGTPAEDTQMRLKKWFKETMLGDRNAGELAVLTGDADYQELGNSPKDMDYIKTVDKTTAFIAMAYGIPLPLVLNDAATFNNYEQAKEVFYTDTVLPMLAEFLEAFGGWLLPRFGLDNAYLCYDEDSVKALESMRERKNDRMRNLVKDGIISQDEARIALGYDPRGGIADDLLVPSSYIPLGQTSEDTENEMAKYLSESGYSENEIKEILSANVNNC